MISSGKYRPRLSIEITEEQRLKLNKLIPWGVGRELFSAIIEDLIEVLEEHGEIIIAAMLSRKLKVQNLPTVSKILEDKKKKRKG